LNDPNSAGAEGASNKDPSQAQNTSLMESETKQGGMSRSHLEHEDEDRSVVTTGDAADLKLKYDKIKNVFKLLIDEAPFLIDDKAFDKCDGKSLKEQFAI